MLGASGLIGNTSTATDGGGGAAEGHESGGTSGGSGEHGFDQGGFNEDEKVMIEDGERAGGGNRWPRQETLTLLQIRSDMDGAFRDSSLKGPLWEEISRKMADHGYYRNPKKCKEKFENVFKYHKRTKGGRSSKPDGKTYRFFEQLEALENTITSPSPSSYQLSPPPRPQSQPPPLTATIAVPMQVVHPTPTTRMLPRHQPITVPSPQNTTSTPQSFTNLMSSFPSRQVVLPPQTTGETGATTTDAANTVNSLSFLLNSTSSSSSTSSDEDVGRRQKRKRKWKDLFDRLMKDVIVKQEELQKSFLESLEKRERDRMVREESWRVEEMARIKREHDLLVQERSISAARESALISFLHQMSNQQNPENQNQSNKQLTPRVTTTVVSVPQVQAPVQLTATTPPSDAPQPQMQHRPVIIAPPAIIPTPPEETRAGEQTPKSNNGGGSESFMGATSSRWPKTEVEALIKLRTELDNKYQENGPKGPLWEEISAGMRNIGYNRNAKRCKEKWENINKYFKKVKESNKKRPEDSKTCPYFHQLDALYREKASAVQPENTMLPIMAQPENQWPLPEGQLPHQQQQQQMLQQQQGGSEEQEGDNINDHEDYDDDGDDG